jgi:2-methylcitrate dehydratase
MGKSRIMSKEPAEMSDESLVKRLASWVAAFDAGKIPAEVVAQAKLLLLDTLGCALAAREEKAFEAALATVKEIGGTPACTVIGTRARASLPGAVLLNGALIRSLDLNDIYVGPKQNGHPSDNIAVALSFGESAGSSGAELLAAIVLGYEIYGRFEDLADPGGSWDHVTVSSVVAPAMAGRLLKLDVDRLAHGMAISAAHGNTLSAVRFGQLSGAKNLANALVASNGALSTLLAKNGLTGPGEILEGPRGLAKAVFAGADLGALVRPAEAPYRIMDVSIKAYPCIGTAQTTVAAAVHAHSLINDPSKDIRSISIRMADVPVVKRQLEDIQRRYPRTRETADHSFYYLAAAGLLDGDVSVSGFKKERWLDADMKAMMERISISADHRLNVHVPGTFPCVLELTTQSGEIKTVEMIHAPGSVKNRMTQAEVEAKFRNSCGAALPKMQQEEVIRQVRNLEKLDSVASLMKKLQP